MPSGGGTVRSQCVQRDPLGRAAARGWPRVQGGDRLSHKTEAHSALIHAALAEVPDITLLEIKARLAGQGADVSIAALWRFFRRHRITRKKDRARRRARPPRHPEAATGLVRAPARSGAGTPVFIDETWASTKMARTHGRAPKGRRPRMSVPHGHWKTTTFVAGIRTTGLVAPFVLDGPINRDAFEVYVDKVLAPDLKPGDVVIMDNLSSHKGQGCAR